MNAPAAFRLWFRPKAVDYPTSAGPWRVFWRRLRRKRLAMASLFVIGLMYFCGIFAPWLAPYSFVQQNISSRATVEQPPSWQHPLGTDHLGRDVYSRIIWGARTASVLSISSITLAVIIGTIFGLLAGYFGGRVDTAIMRVTDYLFAFPSFLLMLLIAATIKPMVREKVMPLESIDFLKGISGQVDYVVLFAALSVVAWPGIARLVRGQVLVVRHATYVEAARSMGASNARILLRHVLPNSTGPLLVAVSMALGGAIASEATLSYLGIGIQPPNASWGTMIAENVGRLRSVPHLLLIPAFVVGLIMLAFNFLGDGINDVLNSRQ